MLWDHTHVFLNGEAWRAQGDDARLLRKLADQRSLDRSDLNQASSELKKWLTDWLRSGWLVRTA